MDDKTDQKIALTRCQLGEWETKVIHPSTGETLRIQIHIRDLDHNPIDDFGKGRIDKLSAICNDAFALRDMYLESISTWRTSQLNDSPNALGEFSEVEIERINNRGIDLSLLVRKEPIELAKWASAFRLEDEVIEVEFGYHYKDYDYTKSKVQGVFMIAYVIDPGGLRWASKLGEDQNLHEDGEGYIEFG
jgi:hypothetical protein